MQLDIVALQEVKPTFPNITSATTLTFPEWQMYCNPHPNGNVNGVAIVVRNTLDPFVKQGPDKALELFQDTQVTMLAITMHLPKNLSAYSTVMVSWRWQDKQVAPHDYDILLGDYHDTIWSHHPTQFWHEKLHTRNLYDPQHELNLDAPTQDAHTRGHHRLDAILLSPGSWGSLNPMTYHGVLMPTSDQRLVMMTSGLSVCDSVAFVAAINPTKHWNKRQETAAIREAECILAQQTPAQDPVKQADSLLKSSCDSSVPHGKTSQEAVEQTRYPTIATQFPGHQEQNGPRITK